VMTRREQGARGGEPNGSSRAEKEYAHYPRSMGLARRGFKWRGRRAAIIWGR
jgi:hypothetical protein